MFDILPPMVRRNYGQVFIADPEKMREELCKAEQKHTLKQVIEWGKELCKHYPEYGLKRECEICWQELQKEVEGG